MSPLITLPNNFVDGVDTALGSEVRANDDAIVGVVNGGLDYQNVAAAPDFPGSIISTTAGRRLTADRMEDGACDSRVLKADSTPGSALAAVGSADNIKDRIITKEKLALGALSSAELGIAVQVIPFNIAVWSSMQVFGAGSVTETGTGLSATDFLYCCVDRYTDSGNYKFNARVGWTYGGGGGIVYLGRKNDFVPSPALSTASTLVLACYIADAQILPATTTFSGNLIIVSIPLS